MYGFYMKMNDSISFHHYCSYIRSLSLVHRLLLPSWRFRFPYTRKISSFRHHELYYLGTVHDGRKVLQFILLVKSYNWWLMKSRAGHVNRGHKFDPRDFPEDIMNVWLVNYPATATKNSRWQFSRGWIHLQYNGCNRLLHYSVVWSMVLPFL